MVRLFKDLEYGTYSVKPLTVGGVFGFFLKVMLVEIFATFLLMPFGTVMPEDSLIFMIASEFISKGLVLWMLVRFYKEEENPLVLSELMEDAFFREEPVVVPKPVIVPRKIFVRAIILMIIGFRFIYDNTISYALVENIEMSEELVEAFDTLFSWPIYAIFSVVIIAPFYEELLFRKFLLGGLLKQTKPMTAIMVSSLFFALIHFNWLQGINAFVLGVIVGWIYYKTESIALCMFAHFVNNFYAMSLGIVQEMFLSEPIWVVNGVLCAIGILLMIKSSKVFERLLLEYSVS